MQVDVRIEAVVALSRGGNGLQPGRRLVSARKGVDGSFGELGRGGFLTLEAGFEFIAEGHDRVDSGNDAGQDRRRTFPATASGRDVQATLR